LDEENQQRPGVKMQSIASVEKVYDREELLASLDGDGQVVREIVQLYLDNAPKMLNTLLWEVENANALGVAEAAHAMKGALLMLRAHKAAALAKGLEESCRRGDLSEAKEKLAELIAAAQEVTAALGYPADQRDRDQSVGG
jgi:two-component system sensor histidine kinase/response regulator